MASSITVEVTKSGGEDGGTEVEGREEEARRWMMREKKKEEWKKK